MDKTNVYRDRRETLFPSTRPGQNSLAISMRPKNKGFSSVAFNTAIPAAECSLAKTVIREETVFYKMPDGVFKLY